MSYPVGKDPFNADSTPDYDDWGIDSYWSCADWIQWHKSMKQKYGKEIADQRWAKAYDAVGWAEHALDCRTYSTEFRDYVKKEKLDGVVFASQGPAALILQPAGAISDVVTNVSSSISTSGKILKWMVPALLIAGAIGTGFYVYKKYIK